MFAKDDIKLLSRSEKHIHDYILKNYNKIPYMTIRELSESCNVSTTTILNFCKKIGCPGYNEFKNELKKYIAGNSLNKIQMLSESLTGFFHVSNSKDLHESIKKFYADIIKSEAVLFVGQGTSGILCKYSARNLSNVGVTAHYIDDPEYPVNFSSYKKWLVVFLSVSGNTTYVVNLAKEFTENGIATVAITSNINSKITSHVNTVISYDLRLKRLSRGDFDITSQLPVLFIIEVVCNLLLDR